MFVQLPGTELWVNLMLITVMEPGKPSGIGGARETLIWFQGQPEPLKTTATIEAILGVMDMDKEDFDD